eukprot:361540-Chlamydomonas_euryale.AAC.2
MFGKQSDDADLGANGGGAHGTDAFSGNGGGVVGGGPADSANSADLAGFVKTGKKAGDFDDGKGNAAFFESDEE